MPINWILGHKPQHLGLCNTEPVKLDLEVDGLVKIISLLARAEIIWFELIWDGGLGKLVHLPKSVFKTSIQPTSPFGLKTFETT